MVPVAFCPDRAAAVPTVKEPCCVKAATAEKTSAISEMLRKCMVMAQKSIKESGYNDACPAIATAEVEENSLLSFKWMPGNGRNVTEG